MNKYNELVKNGFVYLPRFLQGNNTLEIAKQIGKVIESSHFDIVQTLIPQKKISSNTYSGHYGFREFPFHTDLAHWNIPPRYILLRAIRGSSVETRILNFFNLYNNINEDNQMDRVVFFPRDKGQSDVYPISLINRYSDEKFVRYDSLFLEPANETSLASFEFVQNKLHKFNAHTECLSHEGDVLIIDNWKMLHGRGSVSDKDLDREVERVYLEEIYYNVI